VKIRINKILFPTDFSTSANVALAHAVYLARKYDAELHMLHVIELHTEDPHNPAHHFPDHEEILSKLKEQASGRMNEIANENGSSGLRSVRVQERGISAAPVIVEYAEEHEIDLIIIGSHGRRGLRELIVGSTAAEVVRMAPCAVLSVRGARAARPLAETRRVLAPVDFSEHSLGALTVARQVAANYGASLQVLHILENAIHPAFYNMGKMSLRDVAPDIEEKALSALRKQYAEIDGEDVPVEFFTAEGHAGRDIARFAEEHHSDIVVIATHGLSNLAQILLGSVTDKVVRRAPCAVLVTRPLGRRLLVKD
jgi:nucleotide-binding universal stress UspA family protein